MERRTIKINTEQLYRITRISSKSVWYDDKGVVGTIFYFADEAEEMPVTLEQKGPWFTGWIQAIKSDYLNIHNPKPIYIAGFTCEKLSLSLVEELKLRRHAEQK